MDKIEYRVIAETSGNNISYKLLRGSEETGWKTVIWKDIIFDDRKMFVNMLRQGYDFFNKFLTSDDSHKQSVEDKYYFNKHIWEGWKVIDFIDDLKPKLDMIMKGNSWKKPFTNRKDLAKWCTDNQPYYKKVIPEVVSYFADKYNIK